jgi:hypothetical protein
VRVSSVSATPAYLGPENVRTQHFHPPTTVIRERLADVEAILERAVATRRDLSCWRDNQGPGVRP